MVGAGDMTIARPGQTHGLANLGKEDLVFLDIIAKMTVPIFLRWLKREPPNTSLFPHSLRRM